MPSLAQLEEFKSSFSNVGNEKLVMTGKDLPMEELELPDSEPPSPFPEGLAGGPELDFNPAPSFSSIDDLGLDKPADSFAPDPGAEFDFGDLMGSGSLPSVETIPNMDAGPQAPEPGDFSDAGILGDFGDIGGIDAPETSAIEDLPADPQNSVSSEGSFDLEGDLSSFSSDSSVKESPEASFGTEDQDFSDLNISDLNTFDNADITGAEEPAESEQVGELEEAEPSSPGQAFSDIEFPDIDLANAVDMGGEKREPSPDTGQSTDSGDLGDFNSDMADFGADNFSAESLGDFSASDFSAHEEDSATDNSGIDTTESFGGNMELNIPDLNAGIDFGTSDFSAADADLNAGMPGTEDTAPLDTFDDLPGSDESESADAFDGFNMGETDWKAPATTLETPDFSAPPSEELGDFALAGFDDFSEPGAAKSGTADFGPASEEIEEIHLGEEDFRHLQDTLSEYPLNLRIACEELIAEQAVAPNLMSALIKLLVRGAPAKETAALAGKILGKTISISKGYAKQTGAELEAEKSTLGYIFVHSILPVLRVVGAAAVALASLGFLIWHFAIVPLQAERLYKEGYAQLKEGEYVQANDRFLKGVEKRAMKKWFYRYAEGFRDERQYIYAERKYDDLLRFYPRDKKGALDYAAMETNYLKNYEKADRIIRENIVDYAVNDREGLMALAENNLAWGEIQPDRYEEARAAYARLLEKYGRKDPYLEGMLKYFIRTDQLNEVLPLQAHFMTNPRRRKITVPTLAELGGYLLDKRFEETEGVPDEYTDRIEGINNVLTRAIKEDGSYPESYYHLARYYNRYGSISEEREALRAAINTFAAAREETPRRAGYRVDTHRRYAEVLINAREFFPAEEELVRGVRLYEDSRARSVLKTSPEFGRLYADLGDLEFFTKSGDMTAALRFYEEAERNGWAPPEIQYRMGAAHYQREEWEAALQRFFALTPVMPTNKRLLYALGNVSYLRGNYFAAQSYYNRLMDLLDADRVSLPNLVPGSGPDEQDLTERLMVADNNLGVILETLTQITGNTGYRTRALYFFSESIRAWDVLTRNPDNMARMRPFGDLYGPGINLAYLNTQNILRPSPTYEQQIFMRIDRDGLEPSPWEALVPRNYRLSDQLQTRFEQ